jgi:hypothetical protein
MTFISWARAGTTGQASLNQAMASADSTTQRGALNGTQHLVQLARRQCSNLCGATVDTLAADIARTANVTRYTAQQNSASRSDVVATLSSSRPNNAQNYSVSIGLPVAVLMLITLGFQRAVNEYRYRSS